MNWTLDIGGTEKALFDWGLEAPVLTLGFFRADTCELPVLTRHFATTPILAVGDEPVVLRSGREKVDEEWTGGATEFVGRVTKAATRIEDGAQKVRSYTLSGPGYYLVRLPYRQMWLDWRTAALPPNQWTYKQCTTEVFMFVDVDGITPITAGAQVQAILQSAIDQGANFQIGTIDALTPTLPCDQRPTMKCLEAIKYALRLAPQAVLWFDYTTTKNGDPCPTVHCRDKANLTAASLAHGHDTTHDLAVTMNVCEPVGEQISACVLHFRKQGSVDGVPTVTWSHQWAPSDAFALDSNGIPTTGLIKSDYALDAVEDTINLAGTVIQNTYAEVKSAANLSNNATLATRVAWYGVKKPFLIADTADITALTFVSAFQIGAALDNGVMKETMTAITIGDWPYVVAEGTVPDWAGPSIKARVFFSWAGRLYDTTIDENWTARQKLLHTQRKVLATAPQGEFVDVTLTTCAPGLYKIRKSATAAEAEPSGLATYYYNLLKDEKLTGSLTLNWHTFGHYAWMGNKLNVTAGETAWATMAAPVMGVTVDLLHKQTVIHFGWPNHLELRDFMEIFRLWRTRAVWMNPLVMAGQQQNTDSDAIKMPTSVALNAAGIVSPKASHQRLAGTETDHIRVEVDSPPVLKMVSDSAEMVSMDCADLPENGLAKFRWVYKYAKDEYGVCHQYRAKALITDWELVS